VSKSGIMASLSEPILETWRRAIDRLGNHQRQRTFEEAGPDGIYLRGRAMLRTGDLKAAARLFADATNLAPTFTPALEAHAEVLDMMGEKGLATSKYETARNLRGIAGWGAPDRPFVLRNRGPFTAEVAAYTVVLQSIRDRVLPYVARGNALLGDGRAEHALLDYSFALGLKPNLHEVMALKGEALAMLRRYPEALDAFNSALSGRPTDPDIYSGRAIVHLALGKVEAADADWRRQRELLPAEHAAARACVAMRLADYSTALSEFERAIEREPANRYWRLYRLTALHRTGNIANERHIDRGDSLSWPGPLLALYDKPGLERAILERADGQGRRAEALFQLGVLASPCDREEACRRWRDVVDNAPPSLIEYAAARHELARLGC
jgi:tetratricopeptide (TPR) repeat protein